MLQLFVGEANQRLERVLVAEPVVAAHFEDLGADVTLDQTEDVGVRASLDLRQQAALVGAEEWHPVDERQAVRQELLREVEFSMPDDVAIDVPPDPLGDHDGTGVPRGIDVRLHDRLLNRHGWPTRGLGCVVARRSPKPLPSCACVAQASNASAAKGVANVLRVHDGESFPIVGCAAAAGRRKPRREHGAHIEGGTYPVDRTSEKYCFVCISVAVACRGGAIAVASAMNREDVSRLYFRCAAHQPTAGTVALNGRILIVEDDVSVREMLAEYLGTHGYEAVQADGGTVMREAVEKSLPDVVLLDVNLPGEDGFTLARFLRERYDVGIIMVTGSADLADRVAGLEVGADDYVVKPFELRELRARVKSVMRRMQARPPASPAAEPPGPSVSVTCAGGRLHARSRLASAVRRRRTRIPLTAMEFDLLKAFVERPNQVLNRDQLLTLTRNREWEPFDRSIDIRIARVRRKIEADPEHPQAIRTVRGAGYMFVPSPDTA